MSKPIHDLLILGSTLAIVGFALWLALWPHGPVSPSEALPIPSGRISIAGLPTEGPETAKIVVVEFSDFQCRFCGVFAREFLPRLRKQFLSTGTVQLAFRHLPLVVIHSAARRTAESAVCAAEQKRFWQMHDRFFDPRSDLSEQGVRDTVDAIGLDPTSYDRCIRERASRAVDSDLEEARALGVTGTPSFFVGVLEPERRVRVTHAFVGIASRAQLMSVLDAMVAAGR